MAFSIKRGHPLLSTWLCLALVSALAAALLWLKAVHHLELWQAVALLPSRIFLWCLLANRVGSLLWRPDGPLQRGEWLFSAGVVLLATGLLVNDGFRFHGVASLGEGEALAGYDRVERGRLAPLRIPPLVVQRVVAGSGQGESAPQRVGYTLRGMPGEAAVGAAVRLGPASRLRVRSLDLAPRFRLSDLQGAELESAFVKLRLLKAGTEDHFTARLIPHRIYLSLSGKPEAPYHLRVLRGKLISVDRDIRRDEQVSFEGNLLDFPEEARWAEVEVTSDPGVPVCWIGLLLAAAGGVAWARGRCAGPGRERAHP